MIHGNNAIPAALIVDATTVGRAIVTVPNPGEVRYIRINADNTVSTLDAATFLTAIGGDTFDANHTITTHTWTITGGNTLTITGGPVLFEGSSLTVETVGNTFGTNQTVISSGDSAGIVNVITIRNADYTAGGAAGYNANLLNTDFFSINPDLNNIGFAGDINFDGTAFGLGGGAMTVDVTNGTITGSSSGAIINAYNAIMTGPWSFADGAGVSDSGAAGANWTFNAGNSGTPANDSLARVTYMHSTADPNWRGLWLSINAIPNDGGSLLKDDSSYPRNFIAIEQSWDTGLGYRQSEFHCTLNDRRVFQFNVKDTDANFATGSLTVPTTVGIPAANTSGEPALKVIDARPVSGDAMKAILWNQAATGTSGSVHIIMRGDQIGSDDGTHQNYWSILAGHELNNTRSFSITDNLSGGGTRLYIKANGDIGIGNTAPTSKLDVTGTVTATAFVGTGTITLGELDGDQGEAIFRSGEGGSVTLRTDGISETDHAITMPSVSGTMALTSDISTLHGTVMGWLTDSEIDAHFDLIYGNSDLTLGTAGGASGRVFLYGSGGGFVSFTSPALAGSGTITIDAGTNTFSFESGTAKIIVPSTINGTLGSAALTAASEYDPAGSAAAAVSDTAYDATSWNGVTTVAPSKNAVRDIIEALQPLDADLTSWASVTRASGFDTFVATPTLANLNTLVSDADIASLAANTFTGEQTLNGGLVMGFTGAGAGNIFIGTATTRAGNGASTTGTQNVFIGSGCGYITTSAFSNVCIGDQAGSALTTGDYNMAFGYAALGSCASGTYNAAIGASSLLNATGSVNVGIGRNAGDAITTAGNCTFIGASSNGISGSNSYQTAIGSAATCTAANQVMLGTSAEKVTLPGGLVTVPVAQTATTAAVSVAITTTSLTTTAPAQAVTLADGTHGQIKIIKHIASSGGGTAILTPATSAADFNTITFANVGDTATLQYDTTGGWYILALRGAIAA